MKTSKPRRIWKCECHKCRTAKKCRANKALLAACKAYIRFDDKATMNGPQERLKEMKLIDRMRTAVASVDAADR